MEWIALEGTGIGRVWDVMRWEMERKSQLKACVSVGLGLVHGYSPLD